jgi:hypothetical protein
VVVRGTHRHKRRRSLLEQFIVRRYTDEEIRAAYGDERIVTIEGPAGTGFIEDTTCIHKGTAPIAGRRLLLQVQYALNDFGNQSDDADESTLEMLV